ncbi:hypothetical protein BGX31_006669 [Mortierella sp. GBA43]|nr:hypothetical protein BGX31_006669 [Mortierella sp. GBA43]
MPSIHYTVLALSLWTRAIAAELACVSPSSTPSAGSPILLGFSDNAHESTLSDISADLVCSSTHTVALTLGSGYDAKDFEPHSPWVTITEAQAKAALASCPSNTFHLKYTAAVLAGEPVVAHCADVVSIQTTRSGSSPAEAAGLPLPDLPIPLPLPPITTTVPPIIPTDPPAPITTAPTVPTTTQPPPASETAPETEPPAPPTTTAGGTKTTSRRPTNTKTTAAPATQTQQPSPTPSQGQGGGGNGGNPGGSNPNPAPAPAPSGTPDPSSPNRDSSSSSSDVQPTGGSSSPSQTTIITACASIAGGIIVILVAILVWRKREQRKQRVSFDQFYSESLAAASGRDSPTGLKRESSGTNNNSRPSYQRPADLEQGYDGYPAGPNPPPVAQPMRQHQGYRGGAVTPGYGQEYEY